MAYLIANPDESDSFLSPTFTMRHRVRRLVWLTIQSTFYRWSPRPFFGWRSWLLRRFGAKVGRDCFFYPHATIWAPWLLDASDVVTVADGVEIYNPGGLTLEHHSILSQNAFICGASHDFNNPAFPMIWKHITLEPYAWVCARAVVLPGVTVGRGAVLGAAAVTGKNLEPLGVYAGNPAKRVGTRTLIVNE
jgi:putative colanic acid biosynthesis acetyltransferase WcaF